jgi:NAD(P)-dependent dehydrogenase (short-subunit alcohol dehydrogenase family)
MKLQGKVAIVTGGAGGMGEASALLFAENGAAVAVVDLKEEAAARTAGKIKERGGRAIAIGADVTVGADVERIMATTKAQLGPPTILLNNAGVDLEGRRDIVDVDEESFDRTIEVNLKGPWLMMKKVIPFMIEAGGGAIVNTESLAAFFAASSAGYCASKGGLVAMTRVAAVELGKHNIRVNSLCPGATETPMALEERKKLEAQGRPTDTAIINRMSVFGRMATSMEMAKAALFLVSDDSSFATGAPFIIDGGWTSLSGVR